MTRVRWSRDESEVTGGKLKGSVCVLAQQMWSKPSGKGSYLENYISEWKQAEQTACYRYWLIDRQMKTVA